MRRSNLVAAAALALGATLLAADAPPPGPTAADRLYLARLGEALVFSRAVAATIWPEWGLEKTPLLIYEAGRAAYLVNHPKPPSDFSRLADKFPLLGPVHAKFGRDPRFNANTSIDLAGIPTACIGYTTAPSEAETPSLRFIALVFHEAFHAFQARSGKEGKGAVEGILLRYPDLNAENLALSQMEQMILYDLIRFEDAPDPERIRAFLAVRGARARAVGAEFVRGERGIEYQEGIPTFVEVRLLEEARKAAAANPGLGADDPYRLGFAVGPALREADYYGRLLRFSFDSGTVRSRAYATGMALALILERMGADWKGAALSGDKYLDEILADLVPLPPEKSAALLAQARREYGYADLLKIAGDRVARVTRDRKQAEESFRRQEGVQVTVKLPEIPVELRNFDPLNVQPIDATTAIHRRTLSLAFGEGAFYASGVPVMVTLGSGPFDIRGLTFFIPGDDLHLEADFVPVDLEPGIHPFRSSLTLSGSGLSLRGSSGTLTVSTPPLRLDIALKR